MRSAGAWVGVVLHLLAGAFAGVLLLVVGGPPLLYAYGLQLTPGDPLPAELPTTESWKLEVWRQVERSDRVEVRRMTPWTPIQQVATGDVLGDRWPGGRASAWIAGRFVHERAGRLTNLKLHLATWSEMVWITRHWSAEQIASEIAEMERRRLELLD